VLVGVTCAVVIAMVITGVLVGVKFHLDSTSEIVTVCIIFHTWLFVGNSIPAPSQLHKPTTTAHTRTYKRRYGGQGMRIESLPLLSSKLVHILVFAFCGDF